MYNITVFRSESEDVVFESGMPCLPKKDDYIGFCIDNGEEKEWVLEKIIGLDYEFDKKNKLDSRRIIIYF